MKCFVTGASGFIGANLVHELNARGHSVKALLRPNADVRGLKGAVCRRGWGCDKDNPALARVRRWLAGHEPNIGDEAHDEILVDNPKHAI